MSYPDPVNPVRPTGLRAGRPHRLASAAMNSPEGAGNRTTIVVAGLRRHGMDALGDFRRATDGFLEGTMLGGLCGDRLI